MWFRRNKYISETIAKGCFRPQTRISLRSVQNRRLPLSAEGFNIMATPTHIPRSLFIYCLILVSSRLRFVYSQTSPSTQSVHLIGSWDNFTKHYPMEQDIRRARGQWRGCYAFENIICDGDGGRSPKRTGGLKMGSTYYYYVRPHKPET